MPAICFHGISGRRPLVVVENRSTMRSCLAPDCTAGGSRQRDRIGLRSADALVLHAGLMLAERVGFEPTCRLPDKTLSRRPRYDHFGTSPIDECRPDRPL